MSDAGQPRENDTLIGQTIADRYRVLSLLGRGGMGSVYVCEHVQLRKRMALKVLAEEYRRQPELVGRFLKEARAAAQIGHPNIVDVFDLGELPGGGAFIAMALLEGRDLATELDTTGPMPFARARVIIGQICRALAAAHAKGIVHRDLKPANVFLARDADGEEQVKILDFGIAQVSDVDGEAARLTQTGAIVGTPAFMSPEQARGIKIDHRTDIYSVGCILYNLLTSTVVFTGPTLMSVMTKHLFDPPEPPSVRVPPGTVSQALDAVVLRALAKDPDQRYQTMKELWNALESLTDDPMIWPEVTSGRFASVGDMSAAVRSPTPVPTAELRPPRSRWGLYVGLSLAGVGIAVGATIFITRQSSRAAQPTPAVTPATAPTPREVKIEIRADAPGGQVTIRGKQYPLPLKTDLSRNGEAEMVELAAPNRITKRMWVTLDRDVLLDTTLDEDKPAIAIAPEPAAPTVPAHTTHTPHGPAPKPAHVAPTSPSAPTPPTAVVTPTPTPAPTPTAPPPIATRPPEPVRPATPPPPVRPAAPQALAPAIMQRQVQAHRSQIESCIAEDPAATGRLVFRVIVSANGHVETTQLVEAQHRYPSVERCLSKNLSSWTVQPAPGALSEGRATIDLD